MGGGANGEDVSSAGPDLGRRTDHFCQYRGEIQCCCRAWSRSVGGHLSSPEVLPVIVPGDATQLCWTKTFGSMRKDANNVDDTDEVGRTRAHVGPMGGYVDQVSVTQIGHANATQAVKTTLVKMTKG